MNNIPTYCADYVYSEIKDKTLSCTLMPKDHQLFAIGSDLGAYPVPSNCPLKLVDSAPIDADKSSKGVKHDQQKLRYDLLTTEALDAIAEVLTYGAAKYADRNWENGIEYGRVFGALMRHMWAWWKGEDVDPESGLSHLAHAGCNIVFLLTFARRECYADKFDNRPGISRNQSQSISASAKDIS